MPQYRDKSKLVDDKLIINGVNYSVDNLAQLPPDLSAYKVVEKTDENTIVFQGELSPWSYFLNAPFTINNQYFRTSEHWIQVQKALLFGDTTTIDKILKSDTPYEVKKLAYQVNRMDYK